MADFGLVIFDDEKAVSKTEGKKIKNLAGKADSKIC